MAVHIALVEDNSTLQRRFKNNFSLFEEVSLGFVAGSGESAMENLEECSKENLPEIILMDIELPGMSGIETTALIKENYPDIDVVMITVFEDQDKILDSIRSGAVGYLLKDETPQYIVDSILDVKNGGAPMTRSVARKIFGTIKTSEISDSSTTEKEGHQYGLTDREITIIKLLVASNTYTQIAEELCISPHTVKSHIKNIYKKLHVHSKTSLVKIAMKRKMI